MLHGKEIHTQALINQIIILRKYEYIQVTKKSVRQGRWEWEKVITFGV